MTADFAKLGAHEAINHFGPRRDDLRRDSGSDRQAHEYSQKLAQEGSIQAPRQASPDAPLNCTIININLVL